MSEEAGNLAAIAAPIYAALLAPWIAAAHSGKAPVPEGKLAELRDLAIAEAFALHVASVDALDAAIYKLERDPAAA